MDRITLTALGIWLVGAGCAAQGTGLEAQKAQQRHQLYKGCVDTRAKQAHLGSGMAVHEACLNWARTRI